MHITIVLGTARTDNHSKRVARAVFEAFNTHDTVNAQFVDVRDHVEHVATMPVWGTDGLDESLSQWKEISEHTDGFVFVLPEYNRGYPGEWKLLVDSIMKPYKGKPVAVVGVSTGIFGGARMMDHVKPVLVELGFVVGKTALHFTRVKEQFDERGDIATQEQKDRVGGFVETFITDIEKTL